MASNGEGATNGGIPIVHGVVVSGTDPSPHSPITMDHANPQQQANQGNFVPPPYNPNYTSTPQQPQVPCAVVPPVAQQIHSNVDGRPDYVSDFQQQASPYMHQQQPYYPQHPIHNDGVGPTAYPQNQQPYLPNSNGTWQQQQVPNNAAPLPPHSNIAQPQNSAYTSSMGNQSSFLAGMSLRVWGAFVVVGVRRNFAVDAATAAVPTTCGNILVLITTTLPAW
eukprot:CAMPEP_0183301124 /NCGR_PEP_ID=MMETSP0160_2-20130417/7337_1 /TAXON_ID=2839 ORGANISM="Odontella Sinensis, Strain Grunow 1884" /NCGR_SAMPLE_ID=MMETSP0160_2 /ASSEMBLY_ACC=CAM_ASM_000250 /LENGTH=221 /DNA_ID=CAMNT_0025463673 /DNA_START=32 /DNA_END=695 /DNA_ORIENTATION=-